MNITSYIDDDDNNYSRTREDDDNFNAKGWIIRHLRNVKNPEILLLSHQACYNNTDILEYVIKTLDSMYYTQTPLFVKDATYAPDQIREYIMDISSDTLGRICQGFYTSDGKKFVRRHIADPMVYIMTIILNDRHKPLKKVCL